MRFLLVSADQPSIRKSIDVPDRLVQKDKINVKKSKSKKRTASNVKRLGSKIKRVDSKIQTTGSINKPNQTSKSIIRKNGAVHHRDKRRLPE